MSSSDPAPPTPAGPPRWLHALAVLAVCAALPLLLLGAEVTTKGEGVALVDKQGMRSPWHLIILLCSHEFWAKGPAHVLPILIEHGHRLFGWLVGLLAILLAVGLWRRDPRRWVRWLGVAALAAVAIQGLLGAFRVQVAHLVGPELAFVHGCFAQIAFALLVATAFATSRAWTREAGLPVPGAALRLWCSLAIVLVYGQIVLGALVRRTEKRLAPRLHLLVAFAVAAVVVLLVRAAFAQDRGRKLPRRLGAGLIFLLAGQVFLGLESWLTRYRTESVREHTILRPLMASKPSAPGLRGVGWDGLLRAIYADPGFMRSLHFLVGAMLFALVVSMTLYAYRGLAVSAGRQPVSAPRLEGAA